MISLIVAMTSNRIVGRSGKLPWHITEDLRRFNQLTTGHTIVMGRKTYESIGRALPGRNSIVITRQADFAPTGVQTVHDLEDALRLAADDDEIFVIGGAQIYELALPYAERLYVTLVNADIEGDTVFPEINWDEWELVEDSGVQSSRTAPFSYSCQVFQKAR